MRDDAALKWKKRLASGLTATAVVIALPSSVLAVNLLDGSRGSSATSHLSSDNSAMTFTPASIDPGLARILAERSNGGGALMRFTPAGSANPTDRSVTVAVRIGQETAQSLSVRGAIEATSNNAASTAAPGLRIAPTRYNLGLARGYQSFAKTPDIAAASAPSLSRPLSSAAIPDLSEFEPSAGVRNKPSRFGAHIELEETEKKGTAPLTLQATSDQTLDVAGSYRLTRNLDVTAGVRISQERDVRSALPDIEEQDNQAVYIGTQFRF